MMVRLECLLGCALLFSFIAGGNAIKCFVCNSHNQTECADKIPPDNFKTECPRTTTGDQRGDNKHQFILCRKIKQMIDFEVNGLQPETRIIRSCGWDNSSYANKCYQRSGFGGRQEVCACDTNYCNSSPSIIAPLGLLSTFFVIIQLLR